MATVKRNPRPPATTPEARENQLIAAAMDLAEKQLLEGTASAAVVVHYLKLGSIREQLERKKLEEENRLLTAKVDALASAADSSEMYRKALEAMQRYSGQEPGEVIHHEDFDD